VAWWSGVRCCIRPTATSPGLSARPRQSWWERRRELHRPWPDSKGGAPGDLVVITAEDAGWSWALGPQVLRLEPGVARTVQTGRSDIFVMPLAGGLSVEVAAAVGGALESTFELTGRDCVFTRVSTSPLWAGTVR
jgi:5-deoxy-D-glucuronate isomerase